MEIIQKSDSFCSAGYSMTKKSIIVFHLLIILAVSAISAKDVILVIRKDGNDFIDAMKGMQVELRNDFEIKDKVINKKTDVVEIVSEINTTNPRLVVLMDNTSIALFKRYQQGLKENDPLVPSVSIMGVLVGDAIASLKNASGISYEIPIVTSIVSLRSILKSPMRKVGIIHREYLNEFLEQNRKFCEMEGIEIIDIALPNKSNKYKTLLRNGLKDLIGEKKVDVLWVPNDNEFLQPDIIQDVWVPTAKKFKIPVVVGVEVLVKPQLDFGTFAVLPDHISLGSQVAEMIYDISDNDWTCKSNKVDPPLAVYKIINVLQAKRNFNVRDEDLGSVDKKVK
ncbi:MAG: hypothetical protein ACM31E_07965 [Fibrobacterota bacterium]|nr:hypothetical protein [Chitinispirillaceae bacterium]